MAYQSKTWSPSDEVVEEIERRVREMKEKTGSGSPNRVLLNALAASYQASKAESPTVTSELTIEPDKD